MGLRHIRWAERMIAEVGLPQREASVLRVLADKTNTKRQDWTILESDIAKAAGCSTKTVSRAVMGLEARGLIKVKRRRGRTLASTYWLRSDRELVSALVDDRIGYVASSALWCRRGDPASEAIARDALGHLIKLGAHPDEAVRLLIDGLPTRAEVIGLPSVAALSEARAMLGSSHAAQCDAETERAAKRIVAVGGEPSWAYTLGSEDREVLGATDEEVADDPDWWEAEISARVNRLIKQRGQICVKADSH